MQYTEGRNYGFNQVLKDYARFPRFLPLPCHIDHGWSILLEPAVSDLSTDKPCVFLFNKRMVLAWRKKSKIPAYVMGSPYIHYKNAHKITIKSDAKGTVVFPSHSTYFLKSDFNIKEYCKELKTLPAEFQPVTICLFWLDFIDKSADIYRNEGFSVTSAGPRISNSQDFVRNFYRILSSHKYATSNDVGTYLLNAVDLGVPFFLTGKSPVLVNKGMRDVNVGKFTVIDKLEYGKRTRDLFSTGPTHVISREQRKFVEDESGIKDCLSREEMNKILWSYYRENNYWLVAFVPYLFTSIFAFVVFNGPWIKLLMSMRKKMTDKLK
ncbi:MAG: hypothetical protein WC227_00325 [Patescibacteria group bacterium]|jgi:hypothetical protein